MLRYRFLSRPSPSKLGEVIALYQAAGWHDASDTPRRYRAMVAGSHCFAVAEENGVLSGMARAISDGANDAYIQDVFVLPGARGRGVAGRLVSMLLRRLEKDGLRWVGLISGPRAVGLYRRSGFRAMKAFTPMLKK